jgi:hypothetical protein
MEALCLKFCEERLKPLTHIMDFFCGSYEGGCGECFICEIDFPIERKREYVRAWEASRGGPPPYRTFGKVDMHTKAEAYPTLKHARMINSRCDAMKSYVGPAVRSMEKKVYSLPQFIKHVPVAERPAHFKALERAGARYFVTDHTAFESHMVAKLQRACELVLVVYLLRWFARMAADIARADSGLNKCTHRASGVTAEIEGRRMSGDMWTSLFNGWTNLLVTMLVMADLGHTLGVTYDIRVEGDDGLIVMYSGVAPTTADYARCGFTVKLVEVPDTGSCFNGVAFCGLVHEDGQMMRDPSAFIGKFSWAVDADTAGPLRRRQLLAAKAMSAIYETPHCPIVGVIARVALRACGDVVPVYMRDGYHSTVAGKEVPDFAPSQAAREKFSQLFGISPAEQRRVEEEIRRSSSVSCLASVLRPSRAQLHYWAGWVSVG